MPCLMGMALVLLVLRPDRVSPAPAAVMSSKAEAPTLPPRPPRIDWDGYNQNSTRYRIAVDGAENRTVVVACLGGSATAGGGWIPPTLRYGSALRGTFQDMRSPEVKVLGLGHGNTNTMWVSLEPPHRANEPCDNRHLPHANHYHATHQDICSGARPRGVGTPR